MQVKTYYNGWTSVSKEQAISWARHLYHVVTQYPEGFSNKTEYINSRLKGIQFSREELEHGET